MKELHFDKNNPAWSKNSFDNRYWLRANIEYIQDKLRAKGYIYLNEIYEVLMFPWNPDDENVCYRNGTWIDIDFERVEGTKSDCIIRIN